MALTQKLEFRQSQALVMTPQLMQAIKLLQLSNLDLAAYVEGELERNPLLDRSSEGEAEAGGGEPTAPAAESSADDEVSRDDWAADELGTSRTAIEETLGTQLDNVFPEDTGAPATRSEDDPPPPY